MHCVKGHKNCIPHWDDILGPPAAQQLFNENLSPVKSKDASEPSSSDMAVSSESMEVLTTGGARYKFLSNF